MKIATWNVNGIRAREAQFQAWIGDERPDIVCLQEIKATPEQIPAALSSLDDYWCYWHGGKGYSGVAMLVRKDFAAERPEFTHPEFDHETRVVLARLGQLTVLSVYVPNGGKDFAAKMKFLEALDGFVGSFDFSSTNSLVVCGDINVARADIDVHPKERKATAIGQLPEERALFERMLSRGLRDITRDLHPQDDQIFTWWAPWRSLRQRNIGWRIDYVFVGGPLALRATSCKSYREVGTSDHAPLVATFE